MGDRPGHAFRGNQYAAAIARLEKARVSGTSPMGDKMASPFKLNRGMMPMSISKPEYKMVPLAKLIANQDEVYKGGVREKLKEFDRSGPEGVQPVRVTKSGGKFYLTDGHHRAVAAKLLGLKSIEAELQKTKEKR